MEKVILTPRLRLTLLETAEDGTRDLEEMHKLRSSPEATIWSIYGASKSHQQTQAFLKNSVLPKPTSTGPEKYRTTYIIYTRAETEADGESKLVGAVSLKECQRYSDIPYADTLSIPDSLALSKKILKLEVGYSALPISWGKGYTPEALSALLDAFAKAKHVWSPEYESVYYEAVIGPTNPRSQRVAEKVGLKRMGEHRWEGPDTFIGGAMQPPVILVYGSEPKVDG